MSVTTITSLKTSINHMEDFIKAVVIAEITMPDGFIIHHYQTDAGEARALNIDRSDSDYRIYVSDVSIEHGKDFIGCQSHFGLQEAVECFITRLQADDPSLPINQR